MRIEHQGYIQEQPTYQHVGYLSAALMGHVAAATSLFTACLAIALAVSLMIGRRTRAMWGGVAFLVAALPCCAWAVSTVTRGVKSQTRIDLMETLIRLERVCEATDNWIATAGAPLAETAWESQMAGQPFGGRAYSYAPLDSPGPDGQHYEIVSRPTPGADHWYRRHPKAAIRSSWLGADGLYGTDDDDPALTALIGAAHLRYIGHGREPRANPPQTPTPPGTSPPPDTRAS